MIEKSFQNRKLSKSLLEIAKRGVEMAIEKNEQEAEKWIESETGKIEIFSKTLIKNLFLWVT